MLDKDRLAGHVDVDSDHAGRCRERRSEILACVAAERLEEQDRVLTGAHHMLTIIATMITVATMPAPIMYPPCDIPFCRCVA